MRGSSPERSSRCAATAPPRVKLLMLRPSSRRKLSAGAESSATANVPNGASKSAATKNRMKGTTTALAASFKNVRSALALDTGVTGIEPMPALGNAGRAHERAIERVRVVVAGHEHGGRRLRLARADGHSCRRNRRRLREPADRGDAALHDWHPGI